VDRRVPVSVVGLSRLTSLSAGSAGVLARLFQSKSLPALKCYSVIDKESVVLSTLVADAVAGIKQTRFGDGESKPWSQITEPVLST
jgi:hypothetical protein